MKGKVSFDGEEGEGEEEVTVIVKKTIPNVPAMKFSRPVIKPSRGILSTKGDAGEERQAIAINDIRDRTSNDVSFEKDTIAREMLPDDRELERKVREAQRIRAGLRQDSLLEDYISLEKATHEYLDDLDIAVMIGQDSGTRVRRTVRTWEDPDDDAKSEQKVVPADSESEGDNIIDDGLDEETFDVHKQERIRMQIGGEVDLKELSISEVDFDDKETREWELQQIRKGISSGLKTPGKIAKVTKLISKSGDGDELRKKNIPITSLSSIAGEITTESFKKDQSLKVLRENISQIGLHKTECEKSIREVETVINDGIDKIRFYSGLQACIEGWAEVAYLILPKIEELETEVCQSVARRKEGESIDDVQKAIQEKSSFLQSKLDDPSIIIDKVETWRLAHVVSYRDSFVDLCIPSLLEPYLRLDLIGLDPFNEHIPDYIESMLTRYRINDNIEARDGVLSSFAIPWIFRLIKVGFDPYLPGHCCSINTILGDCKLLLPTKALLQSLMTIISDVILDIVMKNEADARVLVKNIAYIQELGSHPNFLPSFVTKLRSALGLPMADVCNFDELMHLLNPH